MDNTNTGLGYGVHGPLRVYPVDTEVVILRGRQRGRRGSISYMAEPHPLSSERRFSIYLYNPVGHYDRRSILINESGFKPLDIKRRVD